MDLKAELFAGMETKRDFMEGKETGTPKVTPAPFFDERARVSSSPNQLHTVETGLRMNDVTRAQILENEKNAKEGWISGSMEYDNRLDKKTM